MKRYLFLFVVLLAPVAAGQGQQQKLIGEVRLKKLVDTEQAEVIIEELRRRPG